MSSLNDTSNARGYFGSCLTVDLSSGNIERHEYDEAFYRKYLSGTGLAARYLWDRLKPGADPLGPDNILGFVPGLLTDTASLFTGRFTVVAKSPASRSLGDANCGGYFSPALKKSGIDGLFITGISEKPVYLFIDHNRVEIHDATEIRGKDTMETEDYLRSKFGRPAQVACIGPAGENLSYISGICNDGGRIAARSGMGAVMGSKRLKAIVARGMKRPNIADEPRVKQLSREFRRRTKDRAWPGNMMNDRLMGWIGMIAGYGIFTRQIPFMWRWMLRLFGTPSLLPYCTEAGDGPIKNWGGIVGRDYPYDKYVKVGMKKMQSYETRRYGCFACPVRCGGHVKVDEGPLKIESMHRPEYETICAFGAMTLNDDVTSIFRMNDLANRAGIDSISLGGVLAFAVECFENGLLTTNDTDGLELRWGNGEALAELTERIVYRQGIGDVLADGVKIAAERIGSGAEQFAVHCGGVEAPMHDAKFDPALAMTYYCESTPGRHTIASDGFTQLQGIRSTFPAIGKAGKAQPGDGPYDAQARELTGASHYKMFVDCVGACLFGTQVGGGLPLVEWTNAATGWELAPDDYLKIGERVKQVRHAINVRDGINPLRDFRPNPRIYGKTPQQSGPNAGVSLDVDAMAEAYFHANHWDTKSAMPDTDYLKNLGLGDVAEELNRTTS